MNNIEYVKYVLRIQTTLINVHTYIHTRDSMQDTQFAIEQITWTYTLTKLEIDNK